VAQHRAIDGILEATVACSVLLGTQASVQLVPTPPTGVFVTAVTVEAPAVAFRKTPKLLLTRILGRLGGFFALNFAVRDATITLIFLVTFDGLVAHLLADTFPTGATRHDRKSGKGEEEGLLPKLHQIKLSFCVERINRASEAAESPPPRVGKRVSLAQRLGPLLARE
jgi:hypothetical protein